MQTFSVIALTAMEIAPSNGKCIARV